MHVWWANESKLIMKKRVFPQSCQIQCLLLPWFFFFFFCEWSLQSNRIIWSETIYGATKKAAHLSGRPACAVMVLSALMQLCFSYIPGTHAAFFSIVNTWMGSTFSGKLGLVISYWKLLQGTSLEAWVVNPQIPDIVVHMWTDTKGVLILHEWILHSPISAY